MLLYSTTIGENLIVTGKVNISLSKFESSNVEAYGLCRLSLSENILIKMLKLNLNLNVSNPDNTIPPGSCAITIDNLSKHDVQIENILAKLSSLHIKGGAKLGTVLTVPIAKIPTLFWIEMTNNSSMLIDRLFVGGNHDVTISRDGSINIIRHHNILTGSNVYASVSAATATDYIYVKSGKGIRFDGNIHVINAIGLFTESGDIIINGEVVSENSIVLAAKQGEVITSNAKLDAKAIAIYSHSNSYFHDTLIKAQNLVLYSLKSYVQISESQIKACNIAVIADGDVSINSSTITSSTSYIKSAKNVSIHNSEVIGYSIFVQSIHDFLQINSNIRLVQHPHVLFANQPSIDKTIIKGSINVATDVEIIGLYDIENKSLPPAKLAWKQVQDISKIPLLEGSAYIEANRGFIIGSTLDSNNSVIIKTRDSIEVVPLTLYNEILDSGGFNKKSIVEVISKINAGLIQINAKNSATFVGSILKAASGTIDSDVIFLLDSPESIINQQKRVKTLTGFIDSGLSKNPTVADYFNFSKSTHVASAISNLNVYSNYSSPELYFTQKHGDIVLDKSIAGYEKLQVTASGGKILITSPNLQDIYQGSGGGNKGKEAAQNARTVIGGGDVYLIADEVIAEAGKFNVSGELKIVAKDGVYLLPVSVHQSLMYHKGSKTTISEHEVRLVVSEINAGYLDIKAGGAFTAVSALINATGVDLDVSELNLLSEHEIFEKRIVFEGKEKWHGGSNESMDYFKDGLVIPTLIKTDKLNAKVTGETTIEAAQILVKEDSTIRTGGNVNILAKYDIHIHDHESSKSYLFNFHKGKLTVSGTKTIKEHFYGENPMPTIYYNQGNFYGYSEGKVHLLGSKIIGDNIYLVADKGIKLEAAAFHQEKIVTISEQGIRTGFSSGGGKHSVDAEFFSKEEKTRFKNTFYDESELIARNSLVLETPELIEMISSKMQFTQAKIKARGLYLHTHSNKMEYEHTQTSVSGGIHFGVQEKLGMTSSKVGQVLNKSGVHWLDILDRTLNGYEAIEGIKDIYQDVEQLTKLDPKDVSSNQSILDNLKSVQYGGWIGVSATSTLSQNQQTQAVDNELSGDNLEVDISEDAVIEGIKCNLGNFTFKAKNLYATASYDTANGETYTSSIDITIPIIGSVGSSVNMGYREGYSSSVSYHSDNIINVAGKLEMNIANNGEIKGITFLADVASVQANNLVIESLQSTLEERMKGMDISMGISSQNIQTFGVKAQMQQRDKAWTEAVGSIIGREVVNVTVQQTLEIAGGLIANADVDKNGSLTDGGKANIQAGKMIVRQLHDFDEGYSYALGINLSKSIDSDSGKIKYGTKVPVVYSFNEKSRDILPTIGQGGINLSDSENVQGYINNQLEQHIGTTSSARASLDANLPISDIWNAIKPNTGIAAGDDYKALVQEEDKADDEDYKEKVNDSQITKEVSKEALYNSLIVLKGSELGLPISQLVNDPKAYGTSADVLNLDLTIAALNKYADTHDGDTAGAASRISKELVDIRQAVIKGGPSFSSVWGKTKANLMSGKTTISNPNAVSLDAIGNMVSYVEDKVGYIVASNMPKTAATLKAGLGYAMEKVIVTGLEGAVEVFGQENVESSINSLKKGLNWVDEKSTKGQQKLLEYAGIYAATKVLSKVISAVKHNKVPHLSEDLISSLSKHEAHGVKILEKNGLNDELRNFSTVREWKEFPHHVAHLETKLPDVQGMKTSYPDGKGTLGIKKEWNGGYSEAVIKRAKHDSEHACQQVDYVSLRSNGQVLSKDGSFITKKPDGLYKANPQKNNPLAPDSKTEVKLPDIKSVKKPHRHPDAHIPLSEWVKWKEWNKP